MTLGSERIGGPRRGISATLLCATFLLGAALGMTAAGRLLWAAGGPTRGDLDQLRRRIALLESELVLARSRKPYLVVDAQEKRLRYSLLGVTMREIPVSEVKIDGLRLVGHGGADGALSLAAIVTLKEKEKDPRLNPLTPEQIESGMDDENVADALPPEAPPDFDLQFKQPISFRVEGVAGTGGGFSKWSSWWRRLWPAGRGKDEIDLKFKVHVEETAAREVYRSLIPGVRLLLVPPSGFLLPDVGQEPPRSIRQGKTARPVTPEPGGPPQGVPFRIPPPVGETQDETPAGGAEASPGDVPPEPAATAPESTPSPENPPVEEPPRNGPEGSPSPPPGGGGGA